MLAWALQPFEEPFEKVANPLAVPALAGPLSAVSTVTLILTGLGIPVGAASLVVRFRRSCGVERQQLRWLALAAALLAVVVLAMVALGAAGIQGPLGWLSAGCVALLPLAIGAAAVSQPSRRRIQAVVDRRFNRRRHDAAQTIATFSTRLRDQVDLDTLTGELLAVVDQTMQPTRASLWLRPQAAATSGQTAAHQVLGRN